MAQQDIWYVTRKNTTGVNTAYPWTVIDLRTNNTVAFGSQTKMESYAEQLNATGYVQVD